MPNLEEMYKNALKNIQAAKEKLAKVDEKIRLDNIPFNKYKPVPQKLRKEREAAESNLAAAESKARLIGDRLEDQLKKNINKMPLPKGPQSVIEKFAGLGGRRKTRNTKKTQKTRKTRRRRV